MTIVYWIWTLSVAGGRGVPGRRVPLGSQDAQSAAARCGRARKRSGFESSSRLLWRLGVDAEARRDAALEARDEAVTERQAAMAEREAAMSEGADAVPDRRSGAPRA